MINVSKPYNYIKKALCFLMVMLCYHFNAQTNLLMEAQDLCNTKEFDKAIVMLDKVIANPETKTDPASWHLRSYAYLQSYKQPKYTLTAKASLLDTAVRSAVQSILLDKTDEFKENNTAFIKSAAASYYKLCITFLDDSLNAVKSEASYLKYKKYTLIFNPEFQFKEKDIEYYKATGSKFAEVYIKNNFNQKYGDIAKVALLKVLELDPKNISANINLGVIYYNQGATLMNMLNYDVDLEQLDVIQENAKKLFKQSLPFMTKVYEMDPKNKQVLESLQGSYSALMDEEKANEFKQKKEALTEQK